MTLQQLREAIDGLAYASPISDTNITGVSNAGTDIVFDFDAR